jgi:protein TonB
MLRVDISETGQVLAMEIENSSGHPRLDQSAMAAVRDWLFVPGRRNGRPAPMTVIVPVSFQVVR